MAGLGKSSLAAEAIHLWHTRFDYVFAFHAKPLALALDEFLRRLDGKLALWSTMYEAMCKRLPSSAVYLRTDGPLKGAARYEQMRANLVEVLRNENILLVLDNFETNLETVADAHGYACQQLVHRLLQVSRAPAQPLLDELHHAGLLATDAETTTYSFHELVRERVAQWMNAHPAERADRTDAQIWRAYAERYEAIFRQLLTSGQEGAMERAAETGRRALSYLVRARGFDRLGSFAQAMVTSTSDPAILRGAIEELRAVVDQAPAGSERWLLRLSLADALRMADRSDEALSFYAQSAAEAEAAEDWSDLGAICQNWAGALQGAGDLPKAKATYLRSAEATRKAGEPRCRIVGSELEALRVAVMQGQAEQAWREIEQRLNEARGWWRRHRAGQSVPEAPDPVLLGRLLVGGLNIAGRAALVLERWEKCLELLEETEQTERDLGQSELRLARTRLNQYGPLLRLGPLGEAPTRA